MKKKNIPQIGMHPCYGEKIFDTYHNTTNSVKNTCKTANELP